MTKSFSFRPLIAAWQLLLSCAALGALLALAFSLVTPLQYSSTVRLLITQPNATGLDPYTAIKSTERIATSLSELVYTTTSFNDILAQAKGFDPTYFPTDEINKRKMWSRAIEIAVTPGTGIMSVTAFHPNRDQARLLVDATANEIAAQAPGYFGNIVHVQVIDSPLDSRWYARPNFVSNGLFGFFIGLLLSLAWVLTKMTRSRERG